MVHVLYTKIQKFGCMGAEQQLVEEINEHTFENLSQEEKDILVSDLQSFDSEVLSGLKKNSSVIHKMFFNSQKDIWTHWTESMEQLHYLGEYKEPLHTISTYIRTQLGKCRFEEDEVADAVRHDQLYDSMNHSIHVRFKDPEFRHRLKESTDNSSDLKLTPDHTFLLEGLQMFKFYHRKFADLAEGFIKKLQDPLVYKDFEAVTEWKEIGLFSHYLNELASENGLLDQIADEQNVKESATLLQRAMFKFLYADGGYRQMAYKFGVSTRQNQRIRCRDSEWPEKDAKAVIMKIQQSYLCPCGCGYNIVTQKKMHDITDDRVFPKFRWSEKRIKIPDSLKNKRLGPIEIAQKIWGKTTKLVVIKAMKKNPDLFTDEELKKAGLDKKKLKEEKLEAENKK